MSGLYFEPVTNAAPVSALAYEKLRLAFKLACEALAQCNCAVGECPDGFSDTHCEQCPYDKQDAFAWQEYLGKRAEEACSSKYHKRLIPPICPVCGGYAVCVHLAYGYRWRCPQHPEWYVGCHRSGNGREPLGTLCGPETRELRVQAHKAFDAMWHGQMTRSRAYKWLAKKLGLSEGETHIALFDADRCREVIEICKQRGA